MMSESLNVIALISGGKDSFYSILHCLQNGHKVVALGNLYPPPAEGAIHHDDAEQHHVTSATGETEHDLNSYMYQTVGHTVIPLYADALGIPLYRQEILGTAVQTGTSYEPSQNGDGYGIDETESLVPLLKQIIAGHPEANAISTGAILSTYQRTRVESVALRLNLVPLSFLWQYPVLPPNKQISLLQDMGAAGLDARIIKVASGGMDESFLWENLASEKGMRRIERAIARFSIDGDGAVLGEGGEFESLVLDGPDHVFRGSIVVEEEDRTIISEGGGAAWLSIRKARVEMKQQTVEAVPKSARIPEMFDSQFVATLEHLRETSGLSSADEFQSEDVEQKLHPVSATVAPSTSIYGDRGRIWTVAARHRAQESKIEQEVQDIVTQLEDLFKTEHLEIKDVNSTVVLLRSMADFGTINKVYGAFFKELNPPARVTIAVGDVFPTGCNVVIQLSLTKPNDSSRPKRALHVQSRSYWAPANIGPYSQAHSVPLPLSSDPDVNIAAVHIAGQIPLVPATMALPPKGADPIEDFTIQAVLSLQHLWRIGLEMDVSWWTGAVAYLSHDSLINIATKAAISGKAWSFQHRKPLEDSSSPSSDDEDNVDIAERDLWEERHHGGMGYFNSSSSTSSPATLPNWSHVSQSSTPPPFFAAEVSSLPRDSTVEWHALLGLNLKSSNSTIVTTTAVHLGSLRIHHCIIGHEHLYSMVLIPHDSQNLSLAETLNKLRQPAEADQSSYYELHTPYTAYLDMNMPTLWDVDSVAAMSAVGIVPCRSLWDVLGRRLGAVLLFRGLVDERW